MDRAASDLDAGFDGLALGVKTAERRQQGRMDIEHLVFIMGNEITAQETHEAGQADDVGLIRFDGVEDVFFKSFFRVEGFAVGQNDRYAPFLSPVHDRCAGDIADQGLDFRIDFAIFDGIVKGDGIGAAARCENDHFLLSHGIRLPARLRVRRNRRLCR